MAGSLALLLGQALVPAEAVGASVFSKGPYIQFPALGSVTVMWEGRSNSPAALSFGPDNNFDRKLEQIRPLERKSQTSIPGETNSASVNYFLYKATIPGLKAGAAYVYSVEMGGVHSPTRQFRTLDPNAASTRFIVYGDSRSDPRKHLALTRQFASHSPDFILHTGDLVAKGRDYSLWSKEFFTPTADVIDRIPFFSVIGNHEQDGTNYLNYFDLPGNKLWYSFDAGPVHVLALDFRSQKPTQEQFRFAREDLLKSKAAWKLVFMHEPMFNIGGHASGWGHSDYLPLFHAARVDMVLAGHSHLYERFRPLAPRSAKSKWCITHITTGGGGANLHTAVMHPALVQHETVNHFMVFEAEREVLRAKAIRVDGALIDAFEIRKPGGQPDPEYLATAYDEESMNLFFEAVAALTPRVRSIPTEVSATEAQFRIPARPKRKKPLRLEIRLTPEASAYYELVDGPLRLSTPPAGTTNFILAGVRSTGLTNIVLNSSKELVPPLAFQAAVSSREGATLAYGGKATVGKLEPAAVRTNDRPERITLQSPRHQGM